MKKFSSSGLFRVALVLGLSGIAPKLRAQALSLDQILDSISVRNPGLQSYAQSIQSREAQARSAHGWDSPSAGFGLNEFPYPSKMGPNLQARKMLMIRLEQVFPSFRRQDLQAAYARSFIRQDRDDQLSMKIGYYTKARLAFYQALIANQKMRVLAEQMDQLNLLIRISQGRLAYSKASLPDIYLARADLSDLKSRRIRLQSLEAQSKAILNVLMGHAPTDSIRLDTTLKAGEQGLDILQADSAYITDHRSDIRHTTDQISSMVLKSRVMASMTRPVFGLSWDNMRMAGGMYMYNMMAMVRIPLAPWSSRGIRSGVEGMQEQIAAMRQMKQDQIQEAMGNIRKDWLALESSGHELDLLEDQVIPAFQQAYQANLNAYGENTGDIFQTLMAWNQLTNKKMTYYDRLEDFLDLRIRLQSALQQY